MKNNIKKIKSISTAFMITLTLTQHALAENTCKQYISLPPKQLYKLAKNSPNKLNTAFKNCLTSEYCSSSNDTNCMPKVLYLSLLANYYINKKQINATSSTPPSALVQSQEIKQNAMVTQLQQRNLANSQQPQLGRQIVPNNNQSSLALQPNSNNNTKYKNISFT